MNVQAICASFKTEFLDGIHNLAADQIKAALYLQGGTLGSGTTAYSPTGEVSGVNYPAGGVVVPSANPPLSLGSTAYWTPSGNIVYPGVTLVAPFDAVLLYNASKGNRAIGVWTFPAVTVGAGNLTISIPANTPATALIQVN